MHRLHCIDDQGDKAQLTLAVAVIGDERSVDRAVFRIPLVVMKSARFIVVLEEVTQTKQRSLEVLAHSYRFFASERCTHRDQGSEAIQLDYCHGAIGVERRLCTG